MVSAPLVPEPAGTAATLATWCWPGSASRHDGNANHPWPEPRFLAARPRIAGLPIVGGGGGPALSGSTFLLHRSDQRDLGEQEGHAVSLAGCVAEWLDRALHKLWLGGVLPGLDATAVGLGAPVGRDGRWAIAAVLSRCAAWPFSERGGLRWRHTRRPVHRRAAVPFLEALQARAPGPVVLAATNGFQTLVKVSW